MTKSKLFLVFALAFNAATIQAQSTSVGIAVGPALSDLRNRSDLPFELDLYEPKLGIASEVNFTWRFSKNMGVRTGLGFEQKGAKSTLDYTNENGEAISDTIVRTKLNYLQIPLMLELRLGGDFAWLFQLGQSYGLLINQQGEEVLMEGFTKTDWSALAGIGLEFPVGEKMKLQLQSRFSYGLNDLAKTSVWEINNFSTGLLVGVQYDLN